MLSHRQRFAACSRNGGSSGVAAEAEQPLDGLMTSIALQMPAGEEEATQASSFQAPSFPSSPALPPLLVYYHLIAP